MSPEATDIWPLQDLGRNRIQLTKFSAWQHILSRRICFGAGRYRARVVAMVRPDGCAIRSLDLWLIAVLVVASFATILRIGAAPGNAAAGVAVVYAPWTPAEQTMLRAVSAGARFVRFGGFDFIAVVVPERANYVQQALAGSALLVVDPRLVAA